MKGFIALLIVGSMSGSAFAETELACWNMYAKRGSLPIFKAQIAEGNVLEQSSLNLKDEWFQSYFVDETIPATADRLVTRRFSTLNQPPEKLEPVEITSNHSTYKGNNGYDFTAGSSTYTYGDYRQDDTYNARLVLPKDLSAEFLKNYRIRTPKERSNAVVIMSPPHFSSQGGNNYLRMFCVSK